MSKKRISENNARLSGEKNWNWKGEKVGYRAIHDWVIKHRCAAFECENCGITSEEKMTKDGRNYIQWANVSGEYRRDTSDFIALCVKCHGWFDSISKTPHHV